MENAYIPGQVGQFITEEDSAERHAFGFIELPQCRYRMKLEYENEFGDNEPHEANETEY